jgi:hypothetical protein
VWLADIFISKHHKNVSLFIRPFSTKYYKNGTIKEQLARTHDTLGEYTIVQWGNGRCNDRNECKKTIKFDFKEVMYEDVDRIKLA